MFGFFFQRRRHGIRHLFPPFRENAPVDQFQQFIAEFLRFHHVFSILLSQIALISWVSFGIICCFLEIMLGSKPL